MLKFFGFPKKLILLLVFVFINQSSFLSASPSPQTSFYVIEVPSKNMGFKRLSENEPQVILRKEDPNALGGSTYTLQTSLMIKAAENFTLDNVTIITNGHSLFIDANDTISAKSTMIKSFQEKRASNFQPVAPASPAEASKDGLPGLKGTNGKSANLVHLKATHLVGNLTILNDGQSGGPGGPGGNGSTKSLQGADGKNYQSEKSLGDAGKVINKLTGKKAVLRPEIQATSGERGSAAGLPGPAGCGGDGGNAGPIIINAENFDLNLYYSLRGGQGGHPAFNSQGKLAHGDVGAAGTGGSGGKRRDETFEPSLGNGPAADAADHPRADIYQKIMNGDFSKAGNIGTSAQIEIRSPEENKNKLPRGLSLKVIDQK